ncbi:MAG: hypothetical protein KJ737_25685 [Proteobacteria bacterium]|nr:hypothetical protein [Pseudomonadota bacterium]
MRRFNIRIYQLYDFIELIFIIVGIIGSVCSIWSVYSSEPSLKQAIIVAISIVTCGTIISLIKIRKLRKVAITNLENLSKCFHATAHHVRNQHAAICKRFKNGEKQLTLEELNLNLNNVCKIVLDNLSTILNEITGEKINVCIKYFCIDQPVYFSKLTHEEKENLCVTVLSRCKYSENRRSNTKDKIIDNTDLKWITFEKYKHFAEPDLESFNRRLQETTKFEKYLDSNSSWKDTYKAKITVPIQLDMSFLRNSAVEGKSYDLLGFITADSPSTSAFRDDNLEYMVEICKAFADVIYRYLERYIYLCGELHNKNGNTNSTCS